MSMRRLSEIAYARSGDKGANANVGVIARSPAGYAYLSEILTAARVRSLFTSTGVEKVIRYELPHLGAINFVLYGALGAGGSQSLRLDAQGKALGQRLLEFEFDIPDDLVRSANDDR